MTSPINSAAAFLGGTSSASNTTSTSSASSSSTSSSGAGSNQTLGEGDFLQLLIAQLSNQDPLNPTDGTEFVTQLSQFSLVEQSVQQSTQLTNISSQLQGLSNQSAMGLIGSTATVQNTSMQWNGTFSPTASVSLGAPAQNVSVAVQDSNGNTVQTIALGAQPAGPLSITWNGKESSGVTAPNGTYTVNVTANNGSGNSVPVSQTLSGLVTQVTVQNGTPSLTLSNGTVAPLSQLVSVSSANAGGSQTQR
jgi:flagellar basal-body rod modification protein FlgD